MKVIGKLDLKLYLAVIDEDERGRLEAFQEGWLADPTKGKPVSVEVDLQTPLLKLLDAKADQIRRGEGVEKFIVTAIYRKPKETKEK